MPLVRPDTSTVPVLFIEFPSPRQGGKASDLRKFRTPKSGQDEASAMHFGPAESVKVSVCADEGH